VWEVGDERAAPCCARVQVADNEFLYLGDSAVALVGRTVLADGSAPTYPFANTVRVCAREPQYRYW